MTDLLIPVIIAVVLITAAVKKCDILSAFCEGARENLITAFELCPTLILLMTAISMFTDSGAAEAISSLLEPLTSRLGFPPECTPLMLIRPISGSGALTALDKILSENPIDSYAAMTACVMTSATETTLYTVAVYFGAVRKKPNAKIFISSFAADLAGFIFAALAVRLML